MSDDTDIAQERRLIALLAEMRQAAASVESTTWGAAKHDVTYLRGRIAENPKLFALLGRLLLPPPVRTASPSLPSHGSERPTARGI
jgi:hypothetical protein